MLRQMAVGSPVGTSEAQGRNLAWFVVVPSLLTPWDENWQTRQHSAVSRNSIPASDLSCWKTRVVLRLYRVSCYMKFSSMFPRRISHPPESPGPVGGSVGD